MKPKSLVFLFLLLVLPVVLIFFLNTGKTHFKPLPIFFPDGIEDSSSTGGQHVIPDFSLTDQEGKPFTRENLKGKIVIADFIFTRCGTICPKMTSELTRVQQAFKDQPDVILVSHTVDPEYDSTNVLKQYAQEYGATYGKWFMLHGPKDKLYRLARKGYVLPVDDGDGGPEDFVHSEKVVLVDKQGRIRGFYDGTNPLKVDTLMLETRLLLQEPDQQTKP